MSSLHEPPLTAVFRRREWADAVNERRLAARVDRGEVVRVAPGAYAVPRAWKALRPMKRHAQRVWEATSRLAPGSVLCHFAAAAVHEIDIHGDWPDLIDISVHRTSGGRSTGRIRRRTRLSADIDVEPWGEHFLTTPAQTVVDLAAVLPFAQGVVAADRALWVRRPGGALLSMEELRRAASDFTGRGAVRARKVVASATGESDSVGETRSRVEAEQLGFPAPELQHVFHLPSGRRVRSDFFWEGFDLVGEFDGIGKYLDPELLQGRTPQQALIEEKDREDELRRIVRQVSRWRTPQIDNSALLWDILTRAGLPTSLPRPLG